MIENKETKLVEIERQWRDAKKEVARLKKIKSKLELEIMVRDIESKLEVLSEIKEPNNLNVKMRKKILNDDLNYYKSKIERTEKQRKVEEVRGWI
jgi:hypothetical protein